MEEPMKTTDKYRQYALRYLDHQCPNHETYN